MPANFNCAPPEALMLKYDEQAKQEEATKIEMESKPDEDSDQEKTRALVILIKCVGLLSYAEANDMDPPTHTFLNNAPNAIIGRKGGVLLFPKHVDSPRGIDRGGMANYDIGEVVQWILKTYPELIDKLAEAVATDETETE